MRAGRCEARVAELLSQPKHTQATAERLLRMAPLVQQAFDQRGAGGGRWQ